MRIYTRRVVVYSLACSTFFVVLNVISRQLKPDDGTSSALILGDPRDAWVESRGPGGGGVPGGAGGRDGSNLYHQPWPQDHVLLEDRIAKYLVDRPGSSSQRAAGKARDRVNGEEAKEDSRPAATSHRHQLFQSTEEPPPNSNRPNIVEFMESSSSSRDIKSKLLWERYRNVSKGLVSSTDIWSDRILPQMNFVPSFSRHSRTRMIYVAQDLSPETPLGRDKFITEHCPVNACFLTRDKKHEASADLRLLQGSTYFKDVPLRSKPRDQIWLIWLLESAVNTLTFENSENLINWTATYRWDSTIVTPYAKFVPSSVIDVMKGRKEIRKRKSRTSLRNYAVGKTKMVAWFVSNCHADNKRLEYAQELGRFLTVDIYGSCGDGQLYCARGDNCTRELLNYKYKFYLAFENSNCEYYITEKFFENALSHDVVPIVMGGRREDYRRAAPPGSYIHVEDYLSPEALAKYLDYLNSNDTAYNEYFTWKGTGEFINTKFWCRLCALLHDDAKPHVWYTNFQNWWRTDNKTCITTRWDDLKQRDNDMLL